MIVTSHDDSLPIIPRNATISNNRSPPLKVATKKSPTSPGLFDTLGLTVDRTSEETLVYTDPKQLIGVEILVKGYVHSFVDFFYLTQTAQLFDIQVKYLQKPFLQFRTEERPNNLAYLLLKKN